MLNTLNMYHPVCLQLVLCAALCKTLYSANSPICGFASRYVLQNLEPPSGLKFLNRAAVNALRPPDMFYGLYRRPLTPVIFLAEISRDKKCWAGRAGGGAGLHCAPAARGRTGRGGTRLITPPATKAVLSSPAPRTNNSVDAVS